MKFRTTLLTTLAVVFFAPQVSAQVIDIFDGQDELPEKTIEVSDTEGNVVIDSGSDLGAGTGALQSDGGITLKFEREGTGILVPATIKGQSVYFLFDTGATYTTLTSSFARSVGSLPPKDAPQSMSNTAAGPRMSQFGLIDRLVLGGRPHTGVTYSICDECPSGVYRGKPIVGLLGLNVVGRYRYSIDEGTGTITMYPHSAYSERRRDITPWLEADIKSEPTDLRAYRAKMTVQNRSPRTITSMSVEISCADGKTHALGPKSVRPKASATFGKEFKAGDCPGMKFDLKDLRW